MEYTITLNEEQLMSLIEIVESHRCEGEDELLSEIRTSMKSQFKKQFFKKQDVETLEEDVLASAEKVIGPGYCDNCD
tara:strand:+ start:893 stop:1123 length:231 start_codon:yes stop_codon:yes gene_type:complete